MAQSAVSTVIGSVGNLAVRETSFLCGVSSEVRFLNDELMRLQGYLKDVDNKWRSGNATAAILVSQIRTAAYEAGNIIEAVDYIEKKKKLTEGLKGAISRYACLPSDLVTLHKVGAKIQLVRRKLNEIFESADRLKIDLDYNVVRNGYSEIVSTLDYIHVNIEDDVVMIGFEDEYKEIVDKLLDKEKILSAVSIVAMGGAGKTTLARKVYASSRVKQNFDTIAWVTVSQTFQSINLLKDIMEQIMGCRYEPEVVDKMHEYTIRKKIHDFLLGKRYLLVMDDVWEVDTWEQINNIVKAFPDSTNGSRILLTTRKANVARHVEIPTHIHALQHLPKEKSWELFNRKALPSYRRSAIPDAAELEEIGRKLARKCDGLPLALSVLGGYLSKNLNTHAWSDVLLGWPSTKDTEMMQEILARSYKDLPSHYLRSCFLYLPAFSEDSVISVSDLIELWIAERFIPHTSNHTLEETSRMYVTELAQRSLVEVVDTSMAHGWIETIRIHDILRDWCIQEAKQDGFLNVVGKTARQVGESSSDTMRSYRSSLQIYKDDILLATPNLQTLLCFGLSSVSFPKLRFLRVLHIEDSILMDFSMIICESIHLRCLRLRRCVRATLPSSVSKLLYLQTIDLRGTTMDSPVPKSFWNIPDLRHVYLSNGFSPPAKRTQQKELRTLWLERCSHDMVVFLSQMTELTTFSLVKGGVPKGMLNILGNMLHLVHISIGQFDVEDDMPQGCFFGDFLQRRRDLQAGEMKQDPLLILEKLPCLVVLKLRGYEVQTISCSAQGFPLLRELHFRDFSTVDWILEEGAMPKLSQLTLWDCSNLRRLPKGLVFLPYLHYMTVCDGSILKELQKKGCEFVGVKYTKI